MCRFVFCGIVYLFFMYTYSFEKLTVWQDSKKLVVHIYEICKQFPDEEKFGLTSQIKRAAVSVSSNLAEGTSRKSPKNRAHFTTIAYSSLMEVLNQLIIAYELNFINEPTYTQTREIIEKVSNKLNSLRNSQLSN